jgi:hypothetical protein
MMRMKWDMNVYVRLSQVDEEMGEGERKGYWRVKKIEIWYMYTYDDSIAKPTKHWTKREWGNGNVMEGLSMFKVYCINVGMITMKSPHITNIC